MSLAHLTIPDWKKFTETDVFKGEFLADVLPVYLQKCRWYGAKNAKVRKYNAEVIVPMEEHADLYYLIIIEVLYETAHTENFLLMLGLNEDITLPDAAKVANVTVEGDEKLLVDGLYCKTLRDFLFRKMLDQSHISHSEGQLNFERGKILDGRSSTDSIESKLLNAEQSNTTLVFDDAYFLKIYRKLFRDPNPDYELTYHLSELAGFSNCPKFAGSITWDRSNSYQVTIGLMQGKIENKGDAWTFMLQEVRSFYNRLEAQKIDIEALPRAPLYKAIKDENIPKEWVDLIDPKMIQQVRKLALRTVEMHLALYKEKYTRRFIPKAFNTDYKAWLLNRLIYHLDQRHYLMESNIDKFEGEALAYAKEFLGYKPIIKDKILNFHTSELNSMRIRIHGDYHLGQVIMTDDDFYILDFEGEPEATIRDRKVKQPPMKDVAGMFRSFHYAIYANCFDEDNPCKLSQEDQFEAGEKYYAYLVGIFLDEYIRIAFEQGLDIGYANEIDFLLRYHILEKGIYELGYEINSRPDWVVIPLKGIMEIIKQDIHA